MLRDDAIDIFSKALVGRGTLIDDDRVCGETFSVMPTQAPYHGLAAVLLFAIGQLTGGGVGGLLTIGGSLFLVSFLFHVLTLAGLLFDGRGRMLYQGSVAALWLLLMGHAIGLDTRMVSTSVTIGWFTDWSSLLAFSLLAYFTFILAPFAHKRLPVRSFLLLAVAIAFVSVLARPSTSIEEWSSFYYVAAIWGYGFMYIGLLAHKRRQ